MGNNDKSIEQQLREEAVKSRRAGVITKSEGWVRDPDVKRREWSDLYGQMVDMSNPDVQREHALFREKQQQAEEKKLEKLRNAEFYEVESLLRGVNGAVNAPAAFNSMTNAPTAIDKFQKAYRTASADTKRRIAEEEVPKLFSLSNLQSNISTLERTLRFLRGLKAYQEKKKQ